MKKLAYLLLSCAALATASGCSKDNDATPSGPKDYQVEYRVSSTSAAVADELNYTNESGGKTQLSQVALPVSYSFKRTMKQGDATQITAGLDAGTATSAITCTILLDGKEVKKATGTGTYASASIAYVIGQ